MNNLNCSACSFCIEIHSQYPLQRHSSVHGSAYDLQVQEVFAQPSLHLQFLSSLHACDAFGSVVHKGFTSPAALMFHPHSVISTCGSVKLRQLAHILLCSIALFMCCINASCVGGQLSITRPKCVNRY